MKTRDLVLIAVYAALYVVLETLDHLFGIFRMPQGGSLSLSVLAIVFASYHLGVKRAFGVAVIAFVVRFIVLPSSVVHPFQFVLDYICAPGAYALCAVIPDIKLGRIKLPVGVLIAGGLQFFFHALSGFMFYAQYYPENIFWGIVGYTATYVVPTFFTAFVIVALIKDRILGYINGN